MLFPLNQVETGLQKIEEIPDTFFEQIETHEEFSYELLPVWFKKGYGTLKKVGIYSKSKKLFDIIKKSGKEEEIKQGYYKLKNIKEHCLNDKSDLFYCEDLDEELLKIAKELFISLYDSFDKEWVNRLTDENVRKYLNNFKRENKVYLCPICGSESIKSNNYESRAALDHWMSKAKYPFLAINWNNLLPMCSNCNGARVKGENEIIWVDNDRTKRQKFFYPYNFEGDIEIKLECLKEPTSEINDFGAWRFNFIGVDEKHQVSIDKWNMFFRVNDRWVDGILVEFIEDWPQQFTSYINEIDFNENIEDKYRQLLISYKNKHISFNLNPLHRVHWHYLNYIIEDASDELFNAYKTTVIKLLEI